MLLKLLLLTACLLVVYFAGRALVYHLTRKSRLLVLIGDLRAQHAGLPALPAFSRTVGRELDLTYKHQGRWQRQVRRADLSLSTTATLPLRPVCPPLPYAKGLILVGDHAIGLWAQDNWQWRHPIQYSAISGHKIRPVIHSSRLFYPESRLLMNKLGKSAPAALKVFNLDQDGAVDLELPLPYIKTRYGWLSGADTSVTADGDRLYLGLHDGTIKCLDTATLQTIWQYAVPLSKGNYKKRVDFEGDLLLHKDMIIAAAEGSFYLLSKANGSLAGMFPFFQMPLSYVVRDQGILFASFSRLYAYSFADKQITVQTNIRHPYLFISPYTQGYVVVGTSRPRAGSPFWRPVDGYVYVLDHKLNVRHSGRVAFWAGPDVHVIDGRLLLLTTKQELLSIRL